MRASALSTGRRRLEGAFYNPVAAAIRKHLAKAAKGFLKVREVGLDVWVPNRYKRIPAEDGVAYMDSAELLETSPDISKRFADCSFGDSYRGRVQDGWLLVPCSGQVYGIIGSVVMAGASLHDQVVSNHVIRVAPRHDAKLRNGYLLTVLSHPNLGQPLVKTLPFGASVPEIDPAEFADLEIVRLESSEENAIADLAEESARLRAGADVLERALAGETGALVDRFVAGDMLPFVTTMPTATINPPPSGSRALPEHARVRLRRALPAVGLKAGALGTVVHVYESGAGYEVEFAAGRKRPAVETLEPEDLEALTDADE